MCFNMAASRAPSDCGQTTSALVRFIHKLHVDSVRPTRVITGVSHAEICGNLLTSVSKSFQLSIRQLGQVSVAVIAATLRTGWVVRDSNLGKGKDYSLFQKKKPH